MVKMSLAAARVNAGLSQKQAAQEMSISNKTLCNWENGRAYPNALQIAKLCALYGVPYDCIIFLPEKPL